MDRISRYIVIIFITLVSCQQNQENQSNQETQAETSSVSTKKVTITEVEKGIRSNIDEMTKEGGGYFKFSNDSIDLSLKLVRVHTEYLSVLGPNEFFACVDLATVEGDVYDVDFFLEGDADNMVVTRTELHKINGKPFYTWKQNKEDKTWYTVPVKNATNELLGVIEGTDSFQFSYEVILPEITSEAEIWIPIATTDEFQAVDITSLEMPTEYKILQEEENGNSILYMNLTPDQSNSKVKIVYDMVRKEKAPYAATDENMIRYLEASSLMPVGDRFGTIANETILNKQADSPLTKARALYDYIIDNMRYAKQGTYGTGDANYACDSKSGNCTEFHSFFISLARSAGIPARFAVGAGIPSERNDGQVDGYHCWAEFYAEGKWWPVDISEANKYTPLATYYFGHHPANRIEFSKGRDLRPDPLPKSGPINFLAYPLLEINGEIVKAKTTFSFLRTEKEV